MANNIIEEWATSKLLILNAQINLTETERIEIESKSEKYRENLIISEYKNKISNNNPDTLISKNEIEFFFNANNENFKLYEEIIKGRYIKLNINAFNILMKLNVGLEDIMFLTSTFLILSLYNY